MKAVNRPRVVIDTNVFISAILIEKSIPGQLLTLWRHNYFELLTSSALIDELSDVSTREKFQIAYPVFFSRTSELINALQLSAVMVIPMQEKDLPIHCRDPKDDILLSCAFGGQATHLITGDLALLNLKDGAQPKDLAIVTANEFLAIFS